MRQAQDILDLMQDNNDTNLDLDQFYGQNLVSSAFDDVISLENRDKTIKFPSRY